MNIRTALEKLDFIFANSRATLVLNDTHSLCCDMKKKGFKVLVFDEQGKRTGVMTVSEIKDPALKDQIQGIAEQYQALIQAPEPTREPVENLKAGGFDLGDVQDAKYEEVEGSEMLPALPPVQGIGGIVRPAVSAMEAVAAWKEFQSLKRMILEKSDLQKIGNKDFVKKSGWRKFATFYNLTDRIVEETQVKSGPGYYWKIKVVCTAPNGRTVEGVGICSDTEKKFAHPDHDVYATAHTRAKNRAISDMIAAGEVSAEEVQASF